MNNKIAFICVNYGTNKYTESFILSLSNYNSEVDYDVFIVDNSKEPSLELSEFCSKFSNVSYIRQSENHGYFAALNFGLKYIESANYRYVVIGNNDLEFDKSFISELCQLNVENNVQVVCPDVITLDGVHQNPHHLLALSKFEILSFDLYFTNYYLALVLKFIKRTYKKFCSKPSTFIVNENRLLEVNQGVGACYILTPAFFSNHKELFFPFFLYGEEAMLSYQVRTSGGILCFAPWLKVNHAESATLSRFPGKATYGFSKESYWQIRKYLT